MLDGLPSSLPSLSKAQRIGERASRVGVDWNEPSQVLQKIKEELQELEAEFDNPSHQNPELIEELGDLLFSAAQLARKLGVESEEVLNQACKKFKKRFEHIEKSCQRNFEALTKEDIDRLWLSAKSLK